MPITRADGVVIYRHPDEYTAITLDGVDVLPYSPIEVMVQPDGRGYVHTLKPMVADGDRAFDGPNKVAGVEKKWIDGQTRNFLYWGTVVVAEP